MDDIVRSVLRAVRSRDPSGIRLRLHPYLHWTEPGVALRGRTTVLAHLEAGASTAEPSSVELRDGQIYRWVVD